MNVGPTVAHWCSTLSDNAFDRCFTTLSFGYVQAETTVLVPSKFHPLPTGFNPV
jgi:hypothetical protein